MTMLGYEGTLPVTMDDMVRHTQAVRRGAPTAWLIGDMPYMSYCIAHHEVGQTGPIIN
jgi:3-methyl-2-oxobutanoate hydroxymethyltransferase